jgi:Protein of unknown function (DUF1838)
MFRTIAKYMIFAGMIAGPAIAQPLDLSKGEDAIVAFRKLQCSAKDGKPSFFHWSGRVYSRVEGEPDRLLFRVEGMNVRQCSNYTDPVRGIGFRQVSREIMIYLDPKTGEVMRSWANPWSGKTVDVIHVANDPVNMRGPSFAKNKDGSAYGLGGRADGGLYFLNYEVPLFYKNPLAGEYQEQVGNQYHAMEMFNFITDEKDLLDRKKDMALSSKVSWVRVAPFLPWMEMGSRPGLMVFNASGHKLASFTELPQVMQDEIRKNYPIYVAPPPVDDARENETSWTYLKKMIDAKRNADKK